MLKSDFRYLCVLLVATWSAACGDASESVAKTWSGQVVDSAGVQIVTNPDEGTWSPGSRPTLVEVRRIGGAGDASPTIASIVDLDVGDDGTLYLADQIGQTIHVFDSTGAARGALGRAGQGPGELSRAIMSVHVTSGGRLVVPDPGLRRLTSYGPHGSVTTAPLAIGGDSPVRWAATADARLIYHSRSSAALDAQQGASAMDHLVRLDARGARDTLLAFPTGGTIRIRDRLPITTIFSPETIWAVADDGSFILGRNDSYRLSVISPDGTLRRVIVAPSQARAVGPRDDSLARTQYRGMLERLKMSPGVIRNVLLFVKVAPAYPVFTRVVAGPEGSIWVQRTAPLDSADSSPIDLPFIGASPRWDVFSREGKRLGALTLPDNFNLMRIRNGRLYGTVLDESDLPTVVILQLDAPDSAWH